MKELLDKYFPILLTFTKPTDRISLTEKELKDFAIAIHNNAVDSCIENGKVYLKSAIKEYDDISDLDQHTTSYGWVTIDKQSLENLKL